MTISRLINDEDGGTSPGGGEMETQTRHVLRRIPFLSVAFFYLACSCVVKRCMKFEFSQSRLVVIVVFLR